MTKKILKCKFLTLKEMLKAKKQRVNEKGKFRQKEENGSQTPTILVKDCSSVIS